MNRPFQFLWKLFGIRGPFQTQEPVLQVRSTGEREPFEMQLAQLMSKMPAALRETFQDSIRFLGDSPLTGPQLLDAVDKIHRGLGAAIGRGSTGEDQRYEALGQVVAWLYEELGRPQDTGYAVLKRAAIALQKREEHQGET